MTLTNERKDLINKIVKLMALAEDQAGKPEADVARNKAAELMAKNNLALQDLESAKATFVKQVKNMGRRTHYKFDTLLWNHVFRFNGVALLLRGDGAYIYIGEQQSIDAAEYMVDMLLEQRKHAVKVWADDEQKAGWGRPGTTDQDKFKNGFAMGVGQKLRNLSSMANTKVQEWGLVPVDAADTALAWYKQDNNVRNGRSGNTSYHGAGLAAGRNASLNKGITKQGKTLAIGH
jgi:hypothetical protein